MVDAQSYRPWDVERVYWFASLFVGKRLSRVGITRRAGRTTVTLSLFAKNNDSNGATATCEGSNIGEAMEKAIAQLRGQRNHVV